MPNLSVGHGLFWRAKSFTQPPAVPSTTKGYPVWQASVTSSCSVVFGPPLDLLRVLWQRLAWTLVVAWRAWQWPVDRRALLASWLDVLERSDLDTVTWLHTMERAQPSPEHRETLDRTYQAITSPLYAVAQQAVRRVAGTVGFTDGPKGALAYKHLLEANAGRRDNLLRHVAATEQIRDAAQAAQIPLRNPELHLVTELAYAGFTTRDERAGRRLEPRTFLQESA